MSKTGLFTHPRFLEHDTGPGHPERPQRLEAILKRLKASSLWSELAVIEPKPTSEKILRLVHPDSYIQSVKQACKNGPVNLDPDTVASPGSWEAALLAVGAVTGAVDRVISGELSSAFCAVRPPGHHASADKAMGFCLFNNVAVGVRYAQQQHGLSRILIVDWDVHHGNGTQAIFYHDPSVLYFSTHQYPFYPGTGTQAEQGHGSGETFTVNMPLSHGAGDREIISAYENALVPKADAFKPDFVFISAGFDAHRDDPLAGLSATEAGYAELTRIVRGIADRHCRGRIVSALEGGYDLAALSASVEAHLRELMR